MHAASWRCTHLSLHRTTRCQWELEAPFSRDRSETAGKLAPGRVGWRASRASNFPLPLPPSSPSPHLPRSRLRRSPYMGNFPLTRKDRGGGTWPHVGGHPRGDVPRVPPPVFLASVFLGAPGHPAARPQGPSWHTYTPQLPVCCPARPPAAPDLGLASAREHRGALGAPHTARCTAGCQQRLPLAGCAHAACCPCSLLPVLLAPPHAPRSLSPLASRLQPWA